jgi:hypothetical protein
LTTTTTTTVVVVVVVMVVVVVVVMVMKHLYTITRSRVKKLPVHFLTWMKVPSSLHNTAVCFLL